MNKAVPGLVVWFLTTFVAVTVGCGTEPTNPLRLVQTDCHHDWSPFDDKWLGAGCIRRGERLPLRVVGGDDLRWELKLDGHLIDIESSKAAPTAIPDSAYSLVHRGRGGGEQAPVLDSERFVAAGWHDLPVPLTRVALQAEVRFQVDGAGEELGEPALWRLKPTVQSVALDFDAGFDMALQRFGLLARRKQLRARILTLVQLHYTAFGVTVGTEAPPGRVEHVRVEIGHKDPNGLGLLGAHNTVGKDNGNLRLDETVGGFNAKARARGRAPYGGVFVGELFVYSRKLHPDHAIADQAFDALFGPFSPELGGTPATEKDDASQAVEALAQLVAGTISHEVGHTLGLAAGTEDAHHDGDHKLWRMDAGKHRPFSERAGLSGTEIWGPVDAAYLAKILPLK